MGIGNPFKSIEKKIKKGLESLGNSIRGNLNKFGHEIEGNLKKTGSSVEGGFKKLGHEIEDGLKKVGHECEGNLKKAAFEIEDTFKEKLPDLFHEALTKIVEEIEKGALHKAVDIIQVAAPSSMELKLGPMSMTVEDIKDKIDTLQEWSDNPPTGHGDIKEMVETLAPSSCSLEISVSLAALFVQSDSLEFGVTLTYTTEQFLESLEDLVGKF